MSAEDIEATYWKEKGRDPHERQKECARRIQQSLARSITERRERKASITLRERVRMDRWPHGGRPGRG